MTAAAGTLLRDLQGAMSASLLYPREHPRIVELTDRILASVRSLPAGRPLQAFWLDGQLVVNGEAMKDGDQAGGGLFALLEQGGAHRITIDCSLAAEGLHRFIDWLVRLRAGGGEAVAPLGAVAGLRLSAVAESDEALRDVAVLFQPLAETWDGIVEEGHYDVNALEYVVMALARTIDRHSGAMIPLAMLRSHDAYTVMHITNVAMLTMALGEAAGLADTAVIELGIAALLHDVGKLRVPPEVLNAPGRLTEEQAAIIKRHPDEGARLLLTTPNVPELAVIVAYEHHVHYAGGGYPTLPAGWRTNLASGITMVADVYDALRSDRPYRRGLAPGEIRSVMRKESGTMFAPALLDAFFDHVVPRTPGATE